MQLLTGIKSLRTFIPTTSNRRQISRCNSLLLALHFLFPQAFRLRGKRMSWAGDWMCGACQHMNFKKRDSCQRCGFTKFGTQADVSAYACSNRTEVLAGDWYCQGMSCGAHNYASRTSCFKCGALKADYSAVHGGFGSENLIPGWKTGDWICTRPGCGVHNYASRRACFKCEMPKDFGEAL